MNNELHLAYQIKRHLNASLSTLPAVQTERLLAAREQALARQKKPASVAQSAGAAGSISISADGSASLSGGGWDGIGWLAQALPVVVLAAGLLGISYWHQSNRAQENADIDTQLLIDELPPSAYADKGFGAWIKRGQE